jgi:PAS domain S-box-containing protein
MEAVGSSTFTSLVGAGGISAEALLSAVADTCDDAIVACGLDGTITSWTTSARRLFGRSEAEAVGQAIWSVFPDHLCDEVQRVVARAAAGDRIRHFETEVVRPDGMPVAVWLSVSPVPTHEGEPGGLVPGGLVIVARDVTEQRLAQAALAEVEARIEQSEALAHTGSWLWDLRTGAVQWSAGFYRIHEVDPLDFGGTLEAYLAAVHPDDRDRLRVTVETSAASGRPFEAEYRVVGATLEHTVVVRAEPAFGSTGSVVGLRGIGQELS